jgi:hypothetical protein
MAQAQQYASHRPGLSLQFRDGMSVLALTGAVDRKLAGRADAALQRVLVGHDDALAIDPEECARLRIAGIDELANAGRRVPESPSR